jgi:hypothetical protein
MQSWQKRALPQAQIDTLESQLTNQRNQRDVLNPTIWNQVKRVRTRVKAAYGDDLSQFEMAGFCPWLSTQLLHGSIIKSVR